MLKSGIYGKYWGMMNKIMDKLMAGTLEVGGITIKSITTLDSFRNKNLNIKIR